uniref:Uncharacterized protein n=1 Tax=mine drainage metagenome TaxID=410659 RepID=E6QU53_9ZZZZ
MTYIYIRFIPAGAGNTPVRDPADNVSPVHPRRRGEHRNNRYAVCMGTGSSPQARGTLQNLQAQSIKLRFIPAGAGNTNFYGYSPIDYAVHPRRRGEHERITKHCKSNLGSSPQARGTQIRNTCKSLYIRFIPAGAGNTDGLMHNL